MNLTQPLTIQNGTIVDIQANPTTSRGFTMVVKKDLEPNEGDRYQVVRPEGDQFSVYDLRDWLRSDRSNPRYTFDRENEEWVNV